MLYPIQGCSRPEFQPSDSISINCLVSSRDNYKLLPYGVAPMAPSGPIDWRVRSVTSLLDVIAETCKRSYDPLKCVQETPGFWSDLAAKFRAAGLASLVDTGYDNINNCFNTGDIYTIPPIDPNSIPNFDLATYPWGKFFNMTYYFRAAPSHVQPAPSPAATWGVYQIYEYPNDKCSADPLSECRFVPITMAQATILGTSCHTYSSLGKDGYPWTKGANASSFKIQAAITPGLTEDEAYNQAQEAEKKCGWYVYELILTERCGGEKVCDCKFLVVNGERSQRCSDPLETDFSGVMPIDCIGAQKVKYVAKGGPYTHKAAAEAKKAELESACLGSSSSEVYSSSGLSSSSSDSRSSDSRSSDSRSSDSRSSDSRSSSDSSSSLPVIYYAVVVQDYTIDKETGEVSMMTASPIVYPGEAPDPTPDCYDYGDVLFCSDFALVGSYDTAAEAYAAACAACAATGACGVEC